MGDETYLYDVFLSHNSDDKPAVEILAARLRSQAGLTVFLDKWNLVPGKSWIPELEQAIAASESIAFFFGPSGLNPWHHDELQLALLNSARARDECRVIPVLLPGCEKEQLPSFLKLRTWVDFRGGLDDDAAFSRLVAGVKGEPIVTEGFSLPDEPAPYRGLLRFEEGDSQFFFGRDRDIGKVIDRLGHASFIAIVGASGSGKSSLVRAGVVPRMRAMADTARWHVLVTVPGQDPLRSLGDSLSLLAPFEHRQNKADELVGRLLARDDALRTGVSNLIADNPQPVLLVVDQFEELFHSKDVAERFIANLHDAVTRSAGQIRVLVTLRADALELCLAYPQLSELLETVHPLGKLSAEELREAIVQPAVVVGAFLEKGLVNVILRDVASEAGTLPLLQFALHEVWKTRRGPWLTLQAYEDAGGVGGALPRRAQATYEHLPESSRPLVRHIFQRLVQTNDGLRDSSRRAWKSELYPVGVAPADVDRVVATLAGASARLIVVDDDSVSVAHESLLRNWPLLQEWIEEDRAFERNRRRVTEAAAEWSAHGCDEGYLFGGARLIEAEALLEVYADRLTGVERDYIVSAVGMRDALARQEREALALRERLARKTWATGLAFQATALLPDKPQRSGLLAVEAVRAFTNANEPPSPQAESALRAVLQRAGGQVIRAGNSAVVALATSDDGCWLAAATADGSTTLWAAETRAQPRKVATLEGLERTHLLVFSPGGEQLGAASENGQLRLWRLNRDGSVAETITFPGHEGKINAIVFSADGDWLISAGQDKLVKCWLTSSTGLHPTVFEHSDRVTSLAVSHDGQRLASGVADGGIVLWNIADLSEPQRGMRLSHHEKMVMSLAFSGDDSWLISGGWDGRVCRWEFGSDPAKVRLLELPDLRDPVYPVTRVVVAPDKGFIVAGCWDPHVIVWTRDNDFTEPVQLAGLKSGVDGLFLSEAADFLVASTRRDNYALVWNPHQVRQVSHPQELRGDDEALTCLAANTQAYIVYAGSRDGTVRVWDLVAGCHAEPEYRFIPGADLNNFAFSANVAHLVTASPSVAIGGEQPDPHGRYWDFSRPGNTVLLGDDEHRANSVAISADGQLVVTGGRDGCVRLTRFTGGKGQSVGQPVRLEDPGHHITAVSISADQRWVATHSNDDLVLIDVTTPQPALAMRYANAHGSAVQKVRFFATSPRILTASSDHSAKIWDYGSGDLRLLATAQHPREVFFASLSPDERWVVTGSLDGTVNCWPVGTDDIDPDAARSHCIDARIGALSTGPGWAIVGGEDGCVFAFELSRTDAGVHLVRLEGHESRVTAVAASPDGTRLASGDADGVVRVWPLAESGPTENAMSLRLSSRSTVAALVFVDAGKSIFAASVGAQQAEIWSLDTSLMLARAAQVVGRNFTQREWREFMPDDYRLTFDDLPAPG